MTSLHSDLKSGVRTLTINRPERANAFNLECITALLRTFEDASRSKSVEISMRGNKSTSVRAWRAVPWATLNVSLKNHTIH